MIDNHAIFNPIRVPDRDGENAIPARTASKSAAIERGGTGVGIAAAAFAHLALAAAGTSLWVRDPVYADREAKLTDVERSLPVDGKMVLMIGTSRTGNGFEAGRVATRLGSSVEAFNFGVPASGPITHRVHLARLLEAGHRPSLLLVEVLPPSLAKLPDGPLESHFLEGGRFSRSELETLEEYGIPQKRMRNEWRETVVTPWYGLRLPLMGRLTPSALPMHRRYDASRNTDAHGWSRIWEEVLTPVAIEEAQARTRRDYGDILHDLKPGGPAGQALRDTLTLARDHGIPTRLVLMPEASWFRALYSAKARGRFDPWIGNLANEAGCPLVDAREWVPDTAFVDGHHLLPEGAASFTDRLTDEVIAPGFDK